MHGMFEAFQFPGFVSLSENEKKVEVLILRDTGAAQSVIVKRALPGIKNNFTGEQVILQDLTGNPSLPLAKIHLHSGLVFGDVVVGVRDDPLPVKDVQFLLGNDLAGSLVIPQPVVFPIPADVDPILMVDEEGSLFPDCVVTRSQVRHCATSMTPSIDTNMESRDSLLTDIRDLFNSENTETFENVPVTKVALTESQQNDKTLASIRCRAVEKLELCKGTGYFYHKNLLMRRYRPVTVANDEHWAQALQVVIPKPYQEMIVELAHNRQSGHLGVNKTCEKILRHFYWPNLRKDVGNFIRSCHVCQVGGKPNQKIPPAPLQPIPVLEEPFSKIIVDCVGPLPKSKKGNQYLLTVMCATTRFPEVIPVRSITSKVITNVLIKLFTKYGIPRVIQSDRGTNFTSELFSQVMKELGVVQYLSTAYHPESQGALERFHQTLKSLIRCYCLENPADWDECLDLLLFAIRDSKHESLGYSPYELLFGREVRGPLKVLKDTWVHDNDVIPSKIQYVNELRDKIKKINSFAQTHLSKYQNRMKSTYDLKSKHRNFKVGDKVLVYLPNQKNSLKNKFAGPYEVLQKIGEVNYVICTPDRRKLTRVVHINLIKPYRFRSDEPSLEGSHVEPPVVLSIDNVVLYEDADDDGITLVPYDTVDLNDSDALVQLEDKLPHLSEAQRNEFKTLLDLYPSICSNRPGVCTLVEHDIVVLPDAQPIKQPSYRVSPNKRQRMKEAVQYLLDHNLAEPSDSPWSSPCLLVTKPDGTDRLCTDYRLVNKLTVSDSFPLPRLDDILDTVGNANYVSKVDLMKGYYQIRLTERARSISAFVTPDGLYQYRFMPFGLKNAPGTFQRMINQVIRGLDGVQAYLDDLVITSDTWQDHLVKLGSLFQRLSEAGLVINLKKSDFAHATVTYLGHVIGQGKLAPRLAKVDSILQYPAPRNRKALRRFLGMAGFYRRFCKNFASVVAPLTNLISPKQKYEWTVEAETSFNNLRTLLATAPVLQMADFQRPFTLQVDACDVGLGAVLLQRSPDTDLLHPVCYYSAKFKKHQRNYSTIEKECLALIMALDKFGFFLNDSPHPIDVNTDHNPLRFVHRMKNHNQRLMRWALTLQPYDIRITHIKGKDNVIADGLSRMSCQE